MNDDDLGASLSRRAASSLSADERNDVIRAARLAATAPPRRAMPRMAGLFVGAAAVVVLVLIALPVLLSPPSVAGPSPNSSTAANYSNVIIRSESDLEAMANDPTWLGRVVVAEATVVSYPVLPGAPICLADEPCLAGYIGDGSNRIFVNSGYRDAPETFTHPLVVPLGVEQVSAFRVGNHSVEYLGPAVLSDQGDGGALLVSNVPAGTETTPTDSVYIVSGWWYSGSWPTCPAPVPPDASPYPEVDYYCQGSWITAVKPDKSMTTHIDGALELPSGPYPSWSDQHSPGDPVQGVFAVRSAGCQLVLVENCPVWRLLDRLDNQPASVTTQPSKTIPASESSVPTPAVEASPSVGLKVFTAQELADLMAESISVDASAVGETVLVDLPAGAVQHDPCASPLGTPINSCNRGTLDSVTGPYTSVTIGLRDADASDGVHLDEGQGYRWVKPLEWPTDAGVYAFKIDTDSAEYLGSVNDASALAVTDLASVKSKNPTDDVFVVNGWLGTTPPAPCAFPQQGLASPMPDITSYYCGGSWLADQQWDAPSSGLVVDGALHVQGDAYQQFAPNPETSGISGTSEYATYLVRNAGCPEVVTGDCPVWRMVGRLDDAAPQPTPTDHSSPKSVPQVRIFNTTTMSLTVAINGQSLGTSVPGTVDLFDPAPFSQPWDVTLTTEGGRVIAELKYSLSDIGVNAGGTNPDRGLEIGQRHDLSCGRLDVTVGGEMVGPTFVPMSTPGDCDETASPSATAIPKPIDYYVTLQPLDPGTTLRLTADRAIELARAWLTRIGGTDTVTGIDVGVIVSGQRYAGKVAWVVEVAANGVPLPGNAACPPTATCTPVWTAIESATAVIDDQTGDLLGMYDKGHDVPGPEASP
jgi:hypothetical protein